MDSNWTKVRQMVANRVLTRHLQDLHDQQMATEMAREQSKRYAERELRTSRNRASSMQIELADSLNPATSRRHSLPVSPRPVTRRTPPSTSRRAQRTDRAGDHMAAGGGAGLIWDHLEAREAGPGYGPEDSGNLLELMANTLSSARAMEQQRPSLYRETPLGGPGMMPSGMPTLPARDRPLAASSKHQRLRASMESAPKLERGETFLNIEHSQVLSLESSSQTDPQSIGTNTKRYRHKKGGNSSYVLDGQNTSDPDSGAVPQPLRRGSVNVDFYDEDTGLKKEDGGFTPQDIILPLSFLQDEEEEEEEKEMNDNGTIVEEEEEEIAQLAEEEAGSLEEHDPWSEVKKCQYIRGYDPPHMRMPKDAVKYIFGDSG